MGTASFTIGAYGKSASRVTMATTVRASGAFTTSGTAANLEDSTATDVIMANGEVLEIYASQAMRIAFGGSTATTSTGFYIPALETRWYECTEPGLVSIIDV